MVQTKAQKESVKTATNKLFEDLKPIVEADGIKRLTLESSSPSTPKFVSIDIWENGTLKSNCLKVYFTSSVAPYELGDVVMSPDKPASEEGPSLRFVSFNLLREDITEVRMLLPTLLNEGRLAYSTRFQQGWVAAKAVSTTSSTKTTTPEPVSAQQQLAEQSATIEELNARIASMQPFVDYAQSIHAVAWPIV
jgi:hypothetical protein